MTEIPDLDLSAEISLLRDEMLAAVETVLDSSRFILGEQVRQFEQELQRYLDVEHVVALNSGTDALVLSLDALGVGAGDEVITTCFSFFATAESICQVGAAPVFVDIEPDSFNLAADKIEEAITERTRAILPVHLFGWPAAMDQINHLARRMDLAVIEDAAQAFGAEVAGRKVGTLGSVGAFSFFPSKTLGGCGDAGAIATHDEQLASRIRALRNHGRQEGEYQSIGYNSRMDELQAALLRVKLPHIDDWLRRRQAVAQAYAADLRDVDWVSIAACPDDVRHAYGQMTVRIEGDRDRDAVREQLQQQGITTRVYYPTPMSDLTVLKDYPAAPTPVAHKACQQVLSLPMGPFLAEPNRKRVVAALRDC